MTETLDIPDFLVRRGRTTLVEYSSPSTRVELIIEEDLPQLPEGLRYAETASEEAGSSISRGIIPRRWAHESGTIQAVIEEMDRQRRVRDERLGRLKALRTKDQSERSEMRTALRKLKEEKMASKKELLQKYNSLAKAAGLKERKQFASVSAAEAAIGKLSGGGGSNGRARRTATGDFRTIRAGTDRAKVFELADGTRTMAQIAQRLKDANPKKIPTILACMRRDCGIDYTIDEGRPKVIPPKGKSRGDVVVAKE